MLKHVFEFQLSSNSAAHISVMSLGGNFGVGGFWACLHPKNLLPVFWSKQRMSSVLVSSSLPL